MVFNVTFNNISVISSRAGLKLTNLVVIGTDCINYHRLILANCCQIIISITTEEHINHYNTFYVVFNFSTEKWRGPGWLNEIGSWIT
jgi:hypothetical protein